MKAFSNSWQTRGAAKHWLIGCGLVLAIFLALAAGGIWWSVNFVKKNVAFEQFDASTKVDPVLTATADEVLPLETGRFKRVSLSINGQDVTETQPANEDSTFPLKASYQAGEDYATVTAVPTVYSDQVQVGNNDLSKATKEKRAPGQGISMGSKLPAPGIGMAVWSNPNWTYAVETTATMPMSFVNEFKPLPGEAKAE